jgi:dipeptidyl aminopeptidase/acylaminoacyl peptidase
VRSAPAVIWSHGYGAYKDVLGGPLVGQRLVPAGYVVLRIDHRGCGESEASPRGRCVQGIESVVDLSAAISFLRAQPEVDPERIGLIGESHGGAAALMAAALDRGASSVVACDAFGDGGAWLRHMWQAKRGPGVYDQLLRKAEDSAQEEALSGSPRQVPVPEVIPYGEADLRFFYQLCEEHPLWSREASLATVHSLGWLVPLALAERLARRPTRLIHGEKDETVPVEEAEALHRAISGSDLRVISGIGHGVTFSEKSAEVLDLIQDWFDRSLRT